MKNSKQINENKWIFNQQNMKKFGRFLFDIKHSQTIRSTNDPFLCKEY